MRNYTGSPWQRLDPEIREALAPMDRFLKEISPAFARLASGRVPEGTGVTIGSPVLGVSAAQTAMPNYLYLPDAEGATQTVNGDVIFAGAVTFSTAAITSVTDDLFYIIDAVDSTRRATFSCAAISTGTLRTYTFPDADGTLVLKDSANTFTRGLTIDNVFTSPGDVLLKLIPDASQSADILQIRNAADSSSVLSVSSAGVLTARDASFLVVDEADTTKTAKFSLGGASAGADLTLAWSGTADRTVTIPNATTTLAGLAVAETWTGAQVFDCVNGTAPEMDIDPTAGTDIYTFQRIVDTSTGFGVNFQISSNIGADADVLFPLTAGTILTGGGTALTTFKMRSSSTSVGAAFAHTSDLTKMLRFVLSGTATGTNNSITLTNTAARNYGLGNLSGNLPIIGDDPPAVASGALGKVDLTAQTAGIGSTNLSNTPPAGLYRVDVYVACTTASGSGAPTLDVNIAWTDVVGATNRNVTAEPGATAFPLSLAATGRSSASLLCQVASGNIAYTTTINAASGSPQYAIYIRVTFLG